MVNKIDSNASGAYIAEEVLGSPKTLPATPIWYEQEPNSYNDFGGEISSVARDIINPSRQRGRGNITDLDASGGYNTDITQDNLTRLMQGFLFADAREKFTTAPFNGTAIPITGATSTTYTAASGLTGFRAGDLVLAAGFTNAANNGLKLLSASASGSVTTTGNVSEASPPAAANLQAVGFQFASGDATMTVTSGVATLGATAKDLTQLGLVAGDWVFVGGDATGEKFATCPAGYARVKSVTASAIVFDKVTATFVTDAGSGKTLRIFFGKFIRNEKTPTLIKTRTYNVERQLGNDGDGIQSEYIEGAVANEFTFNIPQADKLNADLSFVAMDYTLRSGATGVKTGTRVAAAKQAPFNTSRNVYRIRMSAIDAATLEPLPLFAYLSEATITINNNASLAKAVGVLGGFDINVGTFEVGGSVTAYFSSVAALQAVRNNSDVTIDAILAKDNAGLIIDVPLCGLGNGRLSVERDQPVTVPLDTLAAEGPEGYTLGIVFLPYLPNAAMPL